MHSLPEMIIQTTLGNNCKSVSKISEAVDYSLVYIVEPDVETVTGDKILLWADGAVIS